MFSAAEKTNQSATVVQQKAQQQSFFRKAEEDSFFGSSEQPSFFNEPVQAKLSVSSPDDPQEKEADAVAETVMKMPDSASAAVTSRSEEKVDKKEEEEIQAKIETPVLSKISRKEKDKEEIQAKHNPTIFRMSDESFDSFANSDSASGSSETISRKKTDTYHSGIIQRSGRSPPRESIPFEQSLSSTKGSGSALPGETREFMESRFNADFSGVRVHTGSTAQTMSSNIHAHAFAHGNDIYFDEGKFSPHSESGKTLLAHELTHTIQQGASPAKNSGSVAPKTIARKNSIQRSESGVPVQLTNAVEKAKTVEGKIDANKPQADGYRTGWEHLVEIFKTTFGEDKIISGGGETSVEGAVAEQDIKKKREQSGVMVVDKTTVTSANGIPKTKTGSRDAMPSWCGIFAFWALNKSGVPMPKWKLGENMIKPEAARLPGSPPMPGDIAYRNAYSHFAIVESASGNTVKSVNGNTAGEDNLGGQVQTKENPLSDWTAFFDPLKIMKGSLGSGDGPVEEKPKTLRELRKELFHIDRKEENEQENTADTKQTEIQAKPELSTWPIDASGTLNTVNTVQKKTEQEELQKKEDENQEEEKIVAPKLFDVQKKSSSGNEVEKEAPLSEIKSVATPEISQNKSIENISTNHSGTSGNTLALSAEANSRGPPVQLHNSGNIIQGGWFDDALSFVDSAIDFVAEGLEAGKRLLLNQARDFVMAIPGYKALRVVLGEDPITGEEIERNGHNFIEAAFDIMPGGNLLYDKLNELGALTEAEQFIDNGIAAVEALVGGVVSRVERFWNGLSLESLAHPTQIFEDAGNIIHSTIRDVVNFATSAARELLEIVKRWLLTQIVDFIKEHTTAYPLLTVILGEDPITGVPVDRNGTTILSAILELGGEEGIQQRTQMQETGTFQKAADWIDRGISVFGHLLETITGNFNLIWSIVSIDALMHPVDKFNEIYNTFAGPVADVLKFMADTAIIILQFIKEVLMQRLSAWARTVRGYFLVTVIIGKDPFTDVVVERNVENIIHGFMSLMAGGEEQFQQMKESGSIARATQRIDAAVARLNMTPAAIVQLFVDLWNGFTLNDLAHPIEAFQRIIDTFGEPIGRLIAFVVEIVKIVVVVILEIMNFPFDLINNIIARTLAAFESIKRDPIGFLKNLLRAIKQGFIQFFDNIVTHLINGVVGWLMSELRDAGIPELTDFSLQGVIGWVLEVLGISMDKIWEKLAAHPRIGPERVARIRGMIDTLEGIWTFIKDVQERGIVAIWEKIQEQLSNLWNTVIDAVKNWVMEKIVTQVTTKLLSMLDPTGIMAVVNSCIAIYSAIQSFIKYLREMLEVINSFVNGVADIAEGNVATAANYLENTMGRAMPIVIGFLANQVGLGGIGRRVGEMIESVREMVDQALTWLVNKAVDTGMNLLDRAMAMGRSAVAGIRSALGLEETYTNEAGEGHSLTVERNQNNLGIKRASVTPLPITEFLAAKTSEINNPLSTLSNEQKTEMRSAIGEAQVIINTIQSISYPADAPEQSTVHIQQQVNPLLAQLKRKVQLIDKGASPVPPVTVVPGFSSNLASSLNVRYLLKGNHAAGTPASAYSGDMHGATPILRTLGLLPLKWVNFHLLNHNYGGLAVDSNLVPTSKNVNKNFLDSFETPFKDKYDDPTGPKVMWFTAHVTYRSGTVFAQSISAQGGAMKPDGRNWIPDPTQQLPPWSSEISEPVADTVSINNLPSNQSAIRQLARYTPLVADLLVLLSRIKPPVVMGKSTLLSVLGNYARSTNLNPSVHNTYINQINATTFDYSQN